MVAEADCQSDEAPGLTIELDNRLGGDAPLSDIIDWWSEEWCTAMGVQLEMSGSDQAPGIEALQPKNFSANELMVFILSMLNGCSQDSSGIAGMRSFWPMVGIDGEKLDDADPAYIRQIAEKYFARLKAARAELRNN
jgi:hypothetical protein